MGNLILECSCTNSGCAQTECHGFEYQNIPNKHGLCGISFKRPF